MTDYVKNVVTGAILEVIATHDDWLWVKDASGLLHSSKGRTFEPYTPTPVPGEIWEDDKGASVVVVGDTADGGVLALPETASAGDVVKRLDPAVLKNPRNWPRPVAVPKQVDEPLPVTPPSDTEPDKSGQIPPTRPGVTEPVRPVTGLDDARPRKP